MAKNSNGVRIDASSLPNAPLTSPFPNASSADWTACGVVPSEAITVCASDANTPPMACKSWAGLLLAAATRRAAALKRSTAAVSSPLAPVMADAIGNERPGARYGVTPLAGPSNC